MLACSLFFCFVVGAKTTTQGTASPIAASQAFVRGEGSSHDLKLHSGKIWAEFPVPNRKGWVTDLAVTEILVGVFCARARGADLYDSTFFKLQYGPHGKSGGISCAKWKRVGH